MKKDKRTFVQKVIHVCRCFSYKIQYDYISSFSAHASLFMIMSLFPLVMFAFTMLQYLPLEAEELIELARVYVPEPIKPLTLFILNEVYEGVSGSFQWITVIATVLCASKGFYAIMLGLNAVYGIREKRNIVTRYCLAAIYVVVFVLMIILTMLLTVFGKQVISILAHFIPGVFWFHILFQIGRYGIMVLILTLFFLVLFLHVPDRKSKTRYELPGALFTAAGWSVFSFAFSIYLDYFANYSVTYGSLATMIIFMVWFYVAMFILFLGAELNVTLRKYRELHCEFEQVLEYYKKAYELEDLLDRELLPINNRFELIRLKRSDESKHEKQ